MKKILAILNLIASIPVIGGAFGLAYVMFDAGPLDEPTDPGIIGGTNGPTDVFLTCQPEPFSILVLGLYAGLFLVNGIVFWKNQGTIGWPGADQLGPAPSSHITPRAGPHGAIQRR